LDRFHIEALLDLLIEFNAPLSQLLDANARGRYLFAICQNQDIPYIKWIILTVIAFTDAAEMVTHPGFPTSEKWQRVRTRKYVNRFGSFEGGSASEMEG
jgi:hypothetical protein